MRDTEVFKIDGGRLLVDLSEVVAIEHGHDDSVLVLYTRGNHTLRVQAPQDDDALKVIERWIESRPR